MPKKVTNLTRLLSSKKIILLNVKCVSESRLVHTLPSRLSPIFGEHSEHFMSRGRKSHKKFVDIDPTIDDHQDHFTRSSGSKKNAKVNNFSNESDDFDAKDMIAQIELSMNKMVNELKAIKIGRAEPKLIQDIVLDGKRLAEISQIQLRDSYTLAVTPYDTNMSNKIVKAISYSDAFLKPTIENEIVIVPVPKASPEHKKSLLKAAQVSVEKAKQAVRNARRDALGKAKKLNLPKDEFVAADKLIQNTHDSFIKKIDKNLKEKEQELSG